jgi:glycosyltransferase involved in cell wall biosynthesis
VFEPRSAGVPTYVAGLTEGLVRRGWQVSVVAPPANAAMDRLIASGARVVPLRLAHRPSPSDARAIRAIARLCRSGVDVIHGHSTKASLLTASVSRLTGVPSVYTPHAWAFDRPRRTSRLVYGAFERNMSRTHREIVAVADSERRLAASVGIRGAEKIRLVHTGLPEQAGSYIRAEARSVLGLGDRDLVVAWVGRRAPQKRPQDLAPLAAALSPRGIQLVALGYGLGDSPEGAALLASGGRILAEGTDPLALYAAADIFAQTSAWEGCSLAILEAMRAGLPTVAYRVGGLPEQVEEPSTGYLVEPGAVGALATRVIAIARSPRERARIGAAARRRFEHHFAFDQMLDSIESIYRQVGAALPTAAT